MPIRDGKVKKCGIGRDGAVHKGRQHTQSGWYKFASNFCHNKTVIDVGAGLGKGTQILSKTAKSVLGIDPDDTRLSQFGVTIKPIEEIEDKQFDVAVCIDVIEHIIDDKKMLEQLRRVAKEMIIITTPNFNFSKCRNKCHYREYTPEEFIETFSPMEYYTGSSSGKTVIPVQKDIKMMAHHCAIIRL